MSRPMKDSGIAWVGQIPSDWDIHRVKYHFQHDKHVVGIHSSEYERLALTMQGVIKRSKEDNEGLQPEDFASYQILRQNELVFKLIDLQNISTSRVGFSPYEGLVSPAYIVLHANSESYPKYAYYFFLFMWLDAIFNLLGDAGVRSSLNAGDLLNLPLVVPSLPEQQRIAGYLDKKCAEIDTLSNSIQQQIDTLEQYKRAVITETVTKGLNPSAPMKDSGIPWVGKVPAHWDLNKLKYVTTKLERGTAPDYTDEELTRVVNQATFSRGFFNATDIKFSTKPASGSRGLLQKHDVLLASTGGGVLGKTHFFEEAETYVADSHITIARANIKHILPKLLYYLFFINFETFNALMTKGSTNQTELQALDLANMFIPVPPMSEQKQILHSLDKHTQTIDGAIHAKQQQLEKLEQYKKATIFEYVTGKKQVPEV